MKVYPEFSVLMSVYINEKSYFLKESLLSIRKQTILPKEVILVEDGPLTKELYETIDDLKKVMPIISVKLGNNLGLGRALNQGCRYITTDLIARMDSDDVCNPKRFEIQIQKFVEDEKLIISGGQISEFIGRTDNVVSNRIVPTIDQDIRSFAKSRCPFNHPSVMIRKSYLELAGGYKEFKSLEDYHLWIRLLMLKGNVSNSDETLIYMRVGEDMYSRRGGRAYLKQYFKLRALFTKWGFTSKREELLADSAMLISNVVPVKIRAFVYKNILHDKEKR